MKGLYPEISMENVNLPEMTFVSRQELISVEHLHLYILHKVQWGPTENNMSVQRGLVGLNGSPICDIYTICQLLSILKFGFLTYFASHFNRFSSPTAVKKEKCLIAGYTLISGETLK